MYAFFHIAAYYDNAMCDEDAAPHMTRSQIERAYNKYHDMCDTIQRPNYEAQARYDEQWGTHNGYSELDYQLAEREY